MSKRLSIAVLPAALALVPAVRPASAAEVCIAPAVTAALSDCSGIHASVATTRTPVAIPKVAPPPSTKAPGQAPSAPDPKLNEKEIRRALASKRAIPLLLTEIQGIETLLSSTPAGAHDRPSLLKRLADSYVEMEAASFRKKIESRAAADEAKRKDPSKVAGLLAEATKAEKVESAARQAAIKYYGQIRAQHRGFCQTPGASPPSGCLDETLYDLAYEHEQAGDMAEARKVYLELIQNMPASKYVPHAYLAFGELFFQEAQGDPSKWALAEQSYKEVARFPAPDNKVLGYAHYKLAYVYWNKGDFAQALSELKKTIDVGAQFPTIPNAASLSASARRDLVPLFALTGDPKKAYDFFHPLSGDGAGDTEKTFRLMADLGQGYLDVGKYKDGIDLFQDLLKRSPGPKSCEYQGHVTEAVLALKTGDKTAAKAEIDRQIARELRFSAEAHPEEAKIACANLTASLAVETAMIWHLEAVGSGNVRGTMSKETMGYAADLYDRTIARFSAAQFARFEFPRLVKEDWPTLLKVKAARAELLYAAKDWTRCGEAFEQVVEEDPNGPLAPEAAYTSAICHQNASADAHQGRSRHGAPAAPPAVTTPRELDAAEKATIRSFDRFLCVVKPDPSNKEVFDNYTEVAYARAQKYFDARRWPEAAAAFRQVAFLRPGHETSLYAAQLYLEALNVMASHGTPACFADMARDVAELQDKHCAGGKGDADACGNLSRVRRDVDWSELEHRGKQIPSGPGHDKEWEEVANGYLRIWNAYGKEACEAKKPGCDRMDAVLTNAANAFQAAHLMAKTIAVRKMLLDSRYNLDRTALAREAVRKIGAHYQAIAVYDDAAAWYERFAHDTPNEAGAADALQDAIILRLGLGEPNLALHDAELFQKTYRDKHPALSAQIAFAIGAHEAEHGDIAEARRRLGAAMAEIDRSATIDVQIQAHALMGHVLSATLGETAAAGEFARVRSLYKDPAAVAAKIKTGDEAQDWRRLGKVLNAVGEALHFAAAQKEKAAEAFRFPVYKGSGLRKDVEKHIDTKVADWIKKKRPALEEAEKAYKLVLDLQPKPPPRWVIAAGERVGHMWGKFVAEFRAAPIPKEWKQNGPSPYGDLTWEEIRAAYYEAIDRASEPDKKHAKAAYQTCLEHSSRFQFFDDHSRACEGWLSRNYATEFHILDELRGSPTRIGMRVDPTPVLLSP